ncbi:MAG: UDP-N-acetylmuramate--L-alanine ligase [Spirochaetes bacterium]|nr:UDP-N-acetylmuramate--L-alanine ligase [Spirochaetota bacterium]
MFAEKQKIHFIGIGGIGMSGIARILMSMGYGVSGSDLHAGEVTDALKKKGATIYIGHNASNIADNLDLVVTSSAIDEKNPEVLRARERGIVIIHRAEMLAEIMRLRYGIAISGTHGKTTTTSLASHLLADAGLAPTSVIGGKYFNINTNANFGKGRYLVCEADESDGSFLMLSPVLAVVTNIDNDHMDHYGTEKALRDAFVTFINGIPFYGSAFLCFENAAVRAIVPRITKKFYSYGFNKKYDIYASDIRHHDDGSTFHVHVKGDDLGEFTLPLLGEHNILNALAAIGTAVFLKVKPSVIRRSLVHFAGVGRRLNQLAAGPVRVYDDYGHHPTEIKATLAALKPTVQGKLIVVFQPHRYSRTKILFREFGRAFGDADTVIITDIYAAGEKPVKGVNGKLIFSEVKKHAKDVHFAAKDDIIPLLTRISRAGDTVLSLGAGDIYRTGERFAALQKP